MKKILIVLMSHNGYAHLIKKIWDRISKLEIPEGFEVNPIVITEDTEDLVIKICTQQKIPFKSTHVDYNKLGDYLTNPKYKNDITHWSFEKLFCVSQIRNFYLELAIQGNYDYLLQVDGDILPPVDGLKKLLLENKDHIGGIAPSKRPNKHDGYYAVPAPTKEQLESRETYEVSVIGGCFCLENKSIFNIKYLLPDLEPVGSDAIFRCGDIIKNKFKNYCHAGVICKHLI